MLNLFGEWKQEGNHLGSGIVLQNYSPQTLKNHHGNITIWKIILFLNIIFYTYQNCKDKHLMQIHDFSRVLSYV
jgi:hypothetical protein